MRPELYGPRFVARELLKRNAPVTLVSDNMLGALFANGEIRKAYLSYSELGEAGPRAICGSLLVAQLARLHGISVDLQASADEIPSGMDRDVTTFLGERVLPAGAEVYQVEDEVIPWSLLRAGQTEER